MGAVTGRSRALVAAAVLFVLVLAGGAAGRAALAGGLDLVAFRRLQLADDFVAEGAALGDLSGDGRADLVAGPWWYEGPSFEVRRPLVASPSTFRIEGYSDSFFAWVEDLDGDGWNDVLVVGFPGKQAAWLRNPGPSGHVAPWQRHLVLAAVDNESPAFLDLVGDARRELVCQQGGAFGYAAPVAGKPEQPWPFHPISPAGSAGGAFTHGLGVGDVNGDGRADLVEKSGWWEQPASLAGEPAWARRAFAFAERGGAQMLVYDVDGDGRNDIVTSLDAHGYGLAWFEQVRGERAGGAGGAGEGAGERSGEGSGEAISFRKHLVMGSTPGESRHGLAVGQLHALAAVDIDGDGLLDVLTGKRFWAHGGRDAGERDPALLVWFRLERRRRGGEVEVVFVPHGIDDDSGVGTQVTAGDANGDGLADVVVSNKRGTFVHLQERQRDVGYDAWARAQPVERQPLTEGLAPAAAAAHMTAPPGFEVDLIAAEPDLHQPIAFTFDDRGRLWVAEAHTYPVRAPEGKGRDQILIFEDTDGDGSFESRKVFVSGLNLVSGLEVGFGGVFVGAAPHLLFVPDRDADDRPDGEPVVLLDGWGYQDTHETLNAFTWGPDGWLYGCHGVFTHSRVGRPGAPDAERTPIDAGFWRYHPTRQRFEVFAWGTSNPWGIDFDDRGQAFATACVIPHLFHVAQGGRYLRQAGPHFDRYLYRDLPAIADHAHYAGHSHGGTGTADTDAAGGGHAHCGLAIYLADAFPASYRGSLLFANIHGNRVNRDVLERRGSGFVGQHAPDFVRANDRWFRGVALKVGPDGALYMIDWSDAQACHHTDAGRWDRTNGRLFRVRYVGPDAGSTYTYPRVRLRDLTNAELVELQLHANDWYVRTARRLLQERARDWERGDKATYRDLIRLAETHPDETRRLRALWALYVVLDGLPERVALPMRVTGRHEHVRAWTVRLLCESGSPSADLLGRLASMAREDPSPVVRLHLASALQRLPLDARWPIARGLLARGEDASDANIPLMIWYGVEPLAAANPAGAIELASTAAIPEVAGYLVRRAASAGPDGLDAALAALAASTELAWQRLILDEVVRALAGRVEVPAPPSWSAVIERHGAAIAGDPALREPIERLAILFGDRRSFPVLRALLADRAASPERRRRAFEVLTTARDPDLGSVLVGLLDDARFRADAARALGAYDDPAIGAELLRRYSDFDAPARRAAVESLAARPASALALLDAVAKGTVARASVDAFTVRQMTRLGDARVTAELARVWGAVRAPDEDVAAEIARLRAELRPAALAAADLGRGRVLAEQSCLPCHRLFGQGADIGPDLTGSNRRDLDYLLENILAPSAVVGRAYEVEWVKLVDGRLVSGFVVEEDAHSLTLQGPIERTRVALAEVASRSRSELSLMPEGLFDPLAPEAQRDLVAYLQSPAQVARPREGPRVDPATGRTAGALEGEALAVLAKPRGEVRPQAMGGFGGDRWSGGAQLWWTGARPGDRLVLGLPVERAGRYEVEVVLTRARDYAIVQPSVDGQPAGPALDLFHPSDVVTTGFLSLGAFDLAAGRHELAFEIEGANPGAVPAYMVGVDCVALRPASAGASAGAGK